MNNIAEQEELDYTDSDNESDQERFTIRAFQTNRVPFHRSINETDQLLNERIYFNRNVQRRVDEIRAQLRDYARIRALYERDRINARRRLNSNRGNSRAQRRRRAINHRDLQEAEYGYGQLQDRIDEYNEEYEHLYDSWTNPGFEDSD